MMMMSFSPSSAPVHYATVYLRITYPYGTSQALQAAYLHIQTRSSPSDGLQNLARVA
jgi:hypothetical protein